MHINQRHFDAWVSLWHATVDDLFDGEMATQAKLRASTLGWTFSTKMKQGGT
jgi:hemoglobin